MILLYLYGVINGGYIKIVIMLSKNQIQLAEQRSIALYNENEGTHMLPINIDRKCFQKNDAEKSLVNDIKTAFKYNGLREWNERNRPGNNIS